MKIILPITENFWPEKVNLWYYITHAITHIIIIMFTTKTHKQYIKLKSIKGGRSKENFWFCFIMIKYASLIAILGYMTVILEYFDHLLSMYITLKSAVF